VTQHLPGGAGTQPVGITDPLTPGQGGVDQGHRLGAGVGRAGGVAEVEVGVEQLAEQESLSEAGGKQQPSVGDGMVIVEGDGDPVGAVG